MVICVICKSKMCIITRHKSFHRFPVDPKRSMKWIDSINMVNWLPKPHHRICSDHFEDTDFCIIGNRKRLKLDAVPKLFLESEGTDLSDIDTFPSTSDIRSAKLKEKINDTKRYLLDTEKRLIRRKVEARRKMRTKETDAISNSLERKTNDESITYNENVPSSQDDQLEFLTIIGDDDDPSVNLKDEEKHHYKRNLSSPLDKSSKFLKNSENGFSLAEFDDHNSAATLSASEIDEVKETFLNSRTKHPRLIDDCSDDMDNPDTARYSWSAAKRKIASLRMKNRLLQQRNNRLTLKIECLRSLFRYLDQNNFLNQYANAVVKAVISEKPESSSS